MYLLVITWLSTTAPPESMEAEHFKSAAECAQRRSYLLQQQDYGISKFKRQYAEWVKTRSGLVPIPPPRYSVACIKAEPRSN